MAGVNKIDRLPPDEKRWIDELLFAHVPQREIVEQAPARGIDISKSGLGRYAKSWAAKMALFQIASEKAQILRAAIQDGTDITEAAATTATSLLFERLLTATAEEMDKADPLEAMEVLSKISRAQTAHKKVRAEVEEREAKRKAAEAAAKKAEQALDKEAADKDVPLAVLNRMRGAIGLPPLEARRGA